MQKFVLYFSCVRVCIAFSRCFCIIVFIYIMMCLLDRFVNMICHTFASSTGMTGLKKHLKNFLIWKRNFIAAVFAAILSRRL